MPKGAVIFDFDGVIADTESLHLAAYNHALAAHAADIGGPLEILPESYFTRYIVYGDREGLFHMLREHGRDTSAALIDKIAITKRAYFQDRLDGSLDPLPGVRDLLEWLEARNIPRAICSGARRQEIVMLLDAFKLRHHFDEIISIEDVRRGKPDPEGYNLAFDRLNVRHDGDLDRRLAVVIEDSAGGCSAGKAAGLRVLGVATSLPLKDLQQCAAHAVESLENIDKDELAKWLGI